MKRWEINKFKSNKHVCMDCGLHYNQFGMDLVLPRAQWLEINPDEGGLLCATCIVRRCSQLPGATCVHGIIEVFKGKSHLKNKKNRLGSPMEHNSLSINQYIVTLVYYAEFLYDHRDYGKSIECYKKAMELKPNVAYFQLAYGNMLGASGEYKAAKYHIEKSLKLDPKIFLALSSLANVMQIGFGDYKKAKKLYQESLSLYYKDSVTHYNLALLFNTKFEDFEAAKKHYLEAMKFDPEFLEAQISYGIMLWKKLKDYQGALKYFGKANWTISLLVARFFLGILGFNNISTIKNKETIVTGLFSRKKLVELDDGF